ncbi:MAG: NAD(P)/FAD-dependent oxidoreductase, partial [Acidimicrobiales bacterium]
MAADDTNEPSATANPEPLVVIIGAGFAGLAAAGSLANRNVQAVVVDQNNLHTFRPLLYQVGRTPNVSFRHASVTGIDPQAKTVTLSQETTLGYDRLIVASGSAVSYHHVPGAERWALPLYTLDDARRLRNRLVRLLERADENPAAHQGDGPSFVVVGSGPTEVETAGALVELLEVSVERDRMRLGAAPPQVILVDALDRPLTGFTDRSARYATKTLAARGVTLRLGTPVAEITDKAVHLADGETIPADVVVWAGGVTVDGTPAALLPGQKGPGGRVAVDASLALPGHPEIFVAGDATAVCRSPADSRLAPQLAQVAIQTGRHAAEQAWRSVNGEPLEPFVYHDRGIMATIGRRAAVAEIATPFGQQVTLR